MSVKKKDNSLLKTEVERLIEKWGKVLNAACSDSSKALLLEPFDYKQAELIESKPQRFDGSFISDKEMEKIRRNHGRSKSTKRQ
jgi:hypothetical protein